MSELQKQSDEPTQTTPEVGPRVGRRMTLDRRNVAIIAITVIVLAALGVTAMLWRPWEVSVDTHVHDDSNKYTCPMHPQVINDGPGICPICFMDLVPVKGAASADTAGHGLTAQAIALTERGRVIADVATTTVTSRAINSVIDASGGVDYNEATHRVVTARTAGRIERLYVDQTGQYVRKGAPLMDVYSPELVAAQHEYLIARETPNIDLPTLDAASPSRAGDGADRLVRAARRRLELLGMADAQIVALERRGSAATSVTTFAPASGVVLRRGVTEGAYVSVGTLVVELVDLSSVYVIANVLESEAWRIRASQAMTVTGPALGGETMHGSVDYIYPTVDAASRTVRVRGVFANPGLRLKPGMYVSVRVLAPQGEALAVPVGAVIRTGRRDIVYVEVAKNTYEPRDVRIGGRVGEYYELVGGSINKGDRIVSEGGYLIDSESRLGGGAQ